MSYTNNTSKTGPPLTIPKHPRRQGRAMNDFVLLGLGVLSGLFGVALVVFGARVILHEMQTAHWRRSLTAFELRLPRTATVAEVGRWVGTVRAMVRARRWWSILPRWPLVVETTATRAGVRRVLLVPSRLRSEVISTLAALVPGARLDELPDYLTTGERVQYQAAGEARLRGGGDLLALGRAEDTSRHVLATLQPSGDRGSRAGAVADHRGSCAALGHRACNRR